MRGQCRACGMYESCAYPTDPDCADRGRLTVTGPPITGPADWRPLTTQRR